MVFIRRNPFKTNNIKTRYSKKKTRKNRYMEYTKYHPRKITIALKEIRRLNIDVGIRGNKIAYTIHCIRQPPLVFTE